MKHFQYQKLHRIANSTPTYNQLKLSSILKMLLLSQANHPTASTHHNGAPVRSCQQYLVKKLSEDLGFTSCRLKNSTHVLPLYGGFQIRIFAKIDLGSNDKMITIKVYMSPAHNIENLMKLHILRVIQSIASQISPYILKYDPITNQVALCYTRTLNQVGVEPQLFYLEIQEQTLILKDRLLSILGGVYDLEKIFFPSQKNDDSHPIVKDLILLKKYIMASSKYTWTLLQPHSSDVRTQDIYNLLKRDYRKCKDTHTPIQSKARLNNLLHGVTTKTWLALVYKLSKCEDDEIVEKYLSQTSRKGYQEYRSSTIDVQDEQFDKIVAGEVTQIKGLTVTVRELKGYGALRQNTAVRLLPNSKLQCLPVYILRQKQNKNCKYIVTEDEPSCTFERFFDNYETVTSPKTISFIISKITNGVRQLRNCQMVYNNLTPRNIKIKRALDVWLTDLSNIYHPELSSELQRKFEEEYEEEQMEEMEELKDIYDPKNIFPYVSFCKEFGLQNSLESQTADVYSLGMIMWKAYFRRLPSLSRINTCNLSVHLIKPLIAVEITDNFNLELIRMILAFILLATSHAVYGYRPGCFVVTKSEALGKINEAEKEGLSSKRPYLDWATVINSRVQEYFSKAN